MDGAGEVGQLATAVAAARVLDPGRDTSGSHPAPAGDAACHNCGAPLLGEYCHACGQKAHVHRSVSHVLEELLHGISHFDSRFWRTIPLLLVRPGKLTRAYVMGKRQRYIAPVALFLLTVFTMFLVFGFASGPSVPEGAIEVDGKAAEAAAADLRRELAVLEGNLAAARADPARASEVPTLQTALGITRTALARAERVQAEGGYRTGSGPRSSFSPSPISSSS